MPLCNLKGSFFNILLVKNDDEDDLGKEKDILLVKSDPEGYLREEKSLELRMQTMTPRCSKILNYSMDVMKKGTFGPLTRIMVVDNVEALTLMRETLYRLCVGVCSKHAQDAKYILRELDVGTGYWNCCDRVSQRLLWSGRKGPAIGMTLGMDGMHAYVET